MFVIRWEGKLFRITEVQNWFAGAFSAPLPGILPAGRSLNGVPPNVGQEGHHALGVIGRVEAAHGVHSQLIERVQGPLVQRQLIKKEKEN